MTEEIKYNETWNSEGKLIERITVKITTFDDGNVEQEIINTENYEN